jgi:hypothetical protein
VVVVSSRWMLTVWKTWGLSMDSRPAQTSK